jgi:hypothetical protein
MPNRSNEVLREITGVTQDTAGHTLRWFHDDFFDLFVRQDRDGEIVALELCYGVGHAERALVWKKGLGHFHDGPAAPPIDSEDLAARFARECGEVPHRISTSVLRAIKDFPQLERLAVARRRRYRRENWQEQ